jgi:hypothetical protein
MSESINKNSELVVSPSMMTFKEYYMRFLGISDANLANGWGWFVDIELNEEPIRVVQNKYKRSNKYISIPKPIKEYPSIRSMKSMRNLHDTSMIFEMDEDDNLKHRTNNYSLVCANLIGIVALALCYYVTYH